MTFIVIARRETDYWDSEALLKANIREAFGLYLVLEGEATHICSLTPSSRAEWLENAFIPIDPDLEADLDETPDQTTDYIDFVNTDKLDRRLWVRTPYDETTPWDEVHEAFCANPIYPTILSISIFEEYLREQVLRQRANPLPARDLPLFAPRAREVFNQIAADHNITDASDFEDRRNADKALKAEFQKLNW